MINVLLNYKIINDKILRIIKVNKIGFITWKVERYGWETFKIENKIKISRFGQQVELFLGIVWPLLN